ncbi:MAG: P-loop NTPase fold protein, partial [Trichormus sp.]
VQLLLNTEIFVVILAIDDRYISRALETSYKGVLKRGGTPSGVDYLEKIIQIPYKMRAIADADILESYLKSLIEIKIQEDSQVEYTIQEISESRINPLNNQSQMLTQQYIQNEIHETFQMQSSEPEPFQVSQRQSEELLLVEKFTQAEFDMIKECCKHVDLTPRTAKRLINICKIIKIIWTPTPNDKTWEQEPEIEVKQTLIAFLALAGRYTGQMRKILEEIYFKFEEQNEQRIIIDKDKFIGELEQQHYFIDMYNQREWHKFKNDFIKMPPSQEFIFEQRTFNLATSFCFVGDVGYDPDDYYNPQYNAENGKNMSRNQQ